MFKYRVNYTCRSFVLFLVIQNCYESTFGQTQTIVFAQMTMQTQPPPSNTAAGMSGMSCKCVPMGTCAAPTAAGIDIRIVNMGSTACTSGLQYCCTSSGNTASQLNDAACGRRKIPLTTQAPGIASYGAYPWQAALLMPNNNYIGSGVLLDSNNVLTAAHKVATLSNNGFKVRLGEWDAQSLSEQYPYQEYNVAKVFVHPSFNAQNLQNDVAIIRLSSTVPISSSPGISTICPPTGMPAAQTRCWVSGWGKNAFGPNGAYQSIMKEVDVPILDQGNCENRLRGTRLGQFFNLSRDSFMCAGGEANKDACTGDGGSPLVCQIQGQWQLVGLVAWGIGCAMSGVPGVYVNVPNYLTWIMQQIARTD
ncbi:phenoloxidase-activating factor 2 isoform X1 [Neodiprion fabricii]|uniref:phenoloxidase-activating factor 2 isoform X1 n=2 Tax=Neodiprion fabricii TaxID=2872261 RepID=UPI001ED8EB96|nr:phenoloxidase-activating factor 2 isoform X1 [Neodiprion fabricii]